MITLVPLLIFLTSTVATITCDSNKVYVKLTKKSMDHANEEKVEIYGDGVFESSDIFENNSLYSWEYCLDATTNNQYEVWLQDEYGDSWTAGSWLQVEGPYDNIVFKNYMTEDSTEVFALSLYNPIPTGATWNFHQGSIPFEWTRVQFDDSQWSALSPNATITSPSATQYYRYSFSGLQTMAAYEVRFFYKHGIVAHINGLEIYRDNMPEGSITGDTSALGSHNNYHFRGVIRGANEIDINSVLAVEIHMAQNSSEPTREFDAWLSMYAQTAPEKCFIVPTDMTMSPDQKEAHDWNRQEYFFSNQLPVSIDFSYVGNVIPAINGLRIFASNGPTYSPRSFTMGGSSTSDNYNTFLTVDAAIYLNFGYKQWIATSSTGVWRYYRVNVQSTSQSSLRLSEMQPLICNIPVYGSITFTPSYYKFYSKYDAIEIKPNQNDVSGCSVNPPLPKGLTMNNYTCTISGVATEATGNVSYTVTSTMQGGISGSFYLQIVDCEGVMTELERVYKFWANQEGYSILDDVTGESILIVSQEHGDPDYFTVSKFKCITSTRLRIQTNAMNYWATGSVLNIYTILKNSKKEMIARVHHDSVLGMPNPYIVNMQYPIKTNEEWYYKMGEVPSSWYSASTEGWNHTSTFPHSTNRLQLYKKTFSISTLSNITAFTVNVQYRYGIIIMLNDHEAFRHGIEGELSNNSSATSSSPETAFRLISLPIQTYAKNNTPSVQYLKEGSNTIAIALVSITTSQTESVFDCSLRLIHENEFSRVWNYELDRSDKLYGDPFSLSRSSRLYCSTNIDNTMTITFKDGRREWINMFSMMNNYLKAEKGVKSFMIEAKNPEDEDWTPLAEVASLRWSLAGQVKKIYIQPSIPYNMYRFVNFKGESASGWEIQYIDMHIVSTNTEIQPLSYPTPIEVYRGIEMAEVYCEVENYVYFDINPSLPEGITLDSLTGMISGTATEESASQKYTITANKMTGGTSSFEITFGVALCTNGKSLMTMTIKTDYSPQFSHYELYTGREATGQPLKQSAPFGMISSLFYFDFCLPDNIYTMQIVNSNGEGMTFPSGFMMSVDVGAFRLDMQQMAEGVAPVRSSIHFSSYLPFQNEFTEWHISKQSVESSWIETDFDDSNWDKVKLKDIGIAPSTTVYLRRTFSIPSLEDYQVMNVLVKFGGGIIAYMNGIKVARFNLPEYTDSTTEAVIAHDSTKSIFFHVILPMVKASLEKNVMAIEVHRVVDVSSSIPVEFYATATFGVEECSVVRDSYSSLTSTETYMGEIGDAFDVSPMTYAAFDNDDQLYFEWSVENLEGMRFNAIGLYVAHNVNNWSSSVYGQFKGQNYTTIQEIKHLNITQQLRAVTPVPVAIAGFTNYKWKTHSLKIPTILITDMLFLYCRATGSVCEGTDDFPTVSEGQISPSSCGDGYDGYAYRICQGEQFSEVKTDNCIYKAPDRISYSASQFHCIKDLPCSTGTPTYINIITEWYLPESHSLPEGLQLDKETGEIHGTPRALSEPTKVQVFGRNPTSTASVEIIMSIRAAQCQAEGIWNTITVDTVAEYDCALDGSYIGKKRRACLLGKEDGRWGNATGFCVSVLTVVLLVVAVIIATVVIAFIAIRVTRKKKPVKGGKKAKVSKVNKKPETKVKTVKV